jgi:hypothetical protein
MGRAQRRTQPDLLLLLAPITLLTVSDLDPFKLRVVHAVAMVPRSHLALLNFTAQEVQGAEENEFVDLV